MRTGREKIWWEKVYGRKDEGGKDRGGRDGGGKDRGGKKNLVGKIPRGERTRVVNTVVENTWLGKNLVWKGLEGKITGREDRWGENWERERPVRKDWGKLPVMLKTYVLSLIRQSKSPFFKNCLSSPLNPATENNKNMYTCTNHMKYDEIKMKRMRSSKHLLRVQ